MKLATFHGVAPAPEAVAYCSFCDVKFSGKVCPSCRSNTHVCRVPRQKLNIGGIGGTTVLVTDEGTLTVMPDGVTAHARHGEQPGQKETAGGLGMTVAEMNRTHDLTHSLLAGWLGLPCSPTLHGIATDATYEHWQREEAAVLAIQAFAKAAGVDLMALARCH
jgi:hypothetical protein